MRTLLMLTMLGLGTMSMGARADEPGAPACQNVQDEQGAGLVCNNLTTEQANSLAQDPEARRICYRECSFRIFRFCARWHVVCRDYGHGGGWGGGWGGGHGGGWGGGHGGGWGGGWR